MTYVGYRVSRTREGQMRRRGERQREESREKRKSQQSDSCAEYRHSEKLPRHGGGKRERLR